MEADATQASTYIPSVRSVMYDQGDRNRHSQSARLRLFSLACLPPLLPPHGPDQLYSIIKR